jgi:hypothetical protein
MSFVVIAHMSNEEPLEGELDELPPHDASHIVLKHPRPCTGKQEVDWINPNTTTLLISLAHVISIEVLASRNNEDILTKYGNILGG